MRKYLYSLLILSVLAGYGYADRATVNTPKSERGEEIHPFYGGYKYKLVNTTTETVVCSSANAPCLLVQMYMSTGANTTRTLIRDTAAADGAATNEMFPTRKFDTDTAAARSSIIDRPIRASNGITAKLTSITNNEEIVVLYLDQQ